MLGGLRLVEREFEDIALAEPLQLFHFVVVPRDQAALHAQVALHACMFALGGLEIGLCGVESVCVPVIAWPPARISWSCPPAPRQSAGETADRSSAAPCASSAPGRGRAPVRPRSAPASATLRPAALSGRRSANSSCRASAAIACVFLSRLPGSCAALAAPRSCRTAGRRRAQTPPRKAPSPSAAGFAASATWRFVGVFGVKLIEPPWRPSRHSVHLVRAELSPSREREVYPRGAARCHGGGASAPPPSSSGRRAA